MDYLYLYLFVLVFLELSLFGLVLNLRKKFQWLITPFDLYPNIDTNGLQKFVEHGFDGELGWVRKPGTSKEENGRHGKTKYSIDSRGSRSNPGHEGKPKIISCYGDSFVFARQVNDHETFEYYLSGMTETNVQNFGVGNYGFDQAFLRLKREFPSNKTKIVIMGVVPSTIVRILCVWKHYNEFGNVFGFKPRFILSNGGVKLISNIVDDPDKIKKYREYLPEINMHDEFYESKFKKEMLKFPFFLSIFANPLRNIPLIFMIIKDRCFFKETNVKAYTPAMKIIMKRNLDLRKNLFLYNESAKKLLEQLVLEFRAYAIKNNFTPMFLWMLQKDDVLDVKKDGVYYKEFLEVISTKIKTIDLTNELANLDDLDALYSDDSQYGGHFSAEGNKFIAEYIYSELKMEDLI